MDRIISFIFRDKLYSCIIYMDASADPCFVFAILSDKELIEEFDDDITIKTDFEIMLPKKDDYPGLVALRRAIFNAVEHLPEFIAKKKMAKQALHR